MNKKTITAIIVISAVAIAGSVICELFETNFAESTIDWFAFLAGAFLVIEGSYKIFKTRDKFFPDQFLRLVRVSIGMCVFTIHLLQFMRKG